MPQLTLQPEALTILLDYRWPGNIRQLKNVTEQLSILEPNKEITADTLMKYLPQQSSNVPALMHDPRGPEMNEREILYKVLFDMKRDLNDLKKIVGEILQNAGDGIDLKETQAKLADKLYKDLYPPVEETQSDIMLHPVESSKLKYHAKPSDESHTSHSEVVEESLSLADQEKELIKRAIEKHRGKRKYAARELGISERTLYRKLLEYNLK
jgi:DNA-binding NtrC family response regulator